MPIGGERSQPLGAGATEPQGENPCAATTLVHLAGINEANCTFAHAYARVVSGKRYRVTDPLASNVASGFDTSPSTAPTTSISRMPSPVPRPIASSNVNSPGKAATLCS